MNEVDVPGAVPLLSRWEAASLDSVWLGDDDWFTPAVEALAEALEAGDDAREPARRLGRARAVAGVGIAEAIDDLALAYSLGERGDAPLEVVKALCEGWSDGDAAQRVEPAVTDAESGLTTGLYLGQRLAETYGIARRERAQVSESFALVMVDVEVASGDPWGRMARSAAVGHALRASYGAGHPMSRIGDGLFAVLVRRGPALGAGLAAVRDQIARNADRMRVGALLRQPPRIWVEPLPDRHDYAVALLDSLRR
ncbi:hypothetical protein [Demequina pelophila]|uniref:hypothetical protein n=1 Tax=Demequina pelophila TaxID=1638984 RepID=UPI0007813B6C|nr:hypothetical protein [Demequina pelophila]